VHFLSSSWRRALLAALLPLAIGLAPSALGQAAVSETELKAALVFNFARYTEWPDKAFASRDAPLVLCLIGRDHFGGAFTALDGRKLQGRPVKVRSGITVDESRGCHVVYIADVPERQMLSTVRSFVGQPVLTVSDAEGFIDGGGAIGIVPGENRLQFEVNRAALDQAQLKVSSQLLKLARAVLGQGT
jgi:YfiR/HmsC-like